VSQFCPTPHIGSYTKTVLPMNWIKSSIVPININSERCDEFADLFGGKKECLPFTYLGLPMGTTNSRMGHLISIMERINMRLSSVYSFF
jgi:hypothetical protein